MLTILDVNNHWSPTGGGVRRYQLEKLSALAGQPGVRHVFVMPDSARKTENKAENVVIERVPAPLVPGSGGYRYLVRSSSLTKLLARHRPDVVMCGSPIVMPGIVARSLRAAGVDAATIGFWHADFPRTYTGRALGRLGLESAGEELGWWWARRTYGRFDANIVASRRVAERMTQRGVCRCFVSPLGVDTHRFSPDRRDAAIVARLHAGEPRRRTIVFPHRQCAEKGLGVLLLAYERLVERMAVTPALVFAGAGPEAERVNAAAHRFEHVHSLGFVESHDELAAWLASCDVTVALSAWETFGLAAAEAMASGLAVVGANLGAVPELVERADAGACVRHDDPEAVARALERLLGEDDALRNARRSRVRAAVEGLTWEACFERELAVARLVLEARRRGRRLPDEIVDADTLRA